MEELFVIGSLVKASQGREKNEFFLITEKSENYVSLVNGKQRPIQNPKRKNIKHISFIRKSDLGHYILDKSITNAQIIKYLKDYKKSLNNVK